MGGGCLNFKKRGPVLEKGLLFNKILVHIVYQAGNWRSVGSNYMESVRKVWEQGIENNFLQEGRTKYKISWDEKTRN